MCVLWVQGLQMIQWLLVEGAGHGGQWVANLSWNYLKFVGPESGFIFTPIQTLREKILLSLSVFILFIYLCAVFIFNEISYSPYLCHEVVWEQT